MSDAATAFITYLTNLRERDRGALARLKRSLASDPGTDPQVYTYVERFVGEDRQESDSWRHALYLTAGLFAMHPIHREGRSLSTAYGHAARERGSDSLEGRFMTLLGAEPERLPVPLRQIVSILAADSQGMDFIKLLDDLAQWLNPWNVEGRSRLRQRWARDFYQAFDTTQGRTAASTSITSLP